MMGFYKDSWRKQERFYLNVNKGINGKYSKNNIPEFPTKCSHSRQLQMPAMSVGINWPGLISKNDAIIHSSLLIAVSHDFCKQEKKMDNFISNKHRSHWLISFAIGRKTELWKEKNFLVMLTLGI